MAVKSTRLAFASSPPHTEETIDLSTEDIHAALVIPGQNSQLDAPSKACIGDFEAVDEKSPPFDQSDQALKGAFRPVDIEI